MLSALLAFGGLIRVIIGVAPFVAPALAARWLGFPSAHDNATARLFGRLFGARDVGLGVLALWAREHPELIGAVCLFNAAHDAVDAASAWAARAELGRGAYLTAGLALTGGGTWILGYFLSGG